MSLVRTDATPRLVERKSLLVVPGDHLLQFVATDREPVRGACLEQSVDIDPATRLEREAKFLGLVAEMSAQISADPYQVLFVHVSRVNVHALQCASCFPPGSRCHPASRSARAMSVRRFA